MSESQNETTPLKKADAPKGDAQFNRLGTASIPKLLLEFAIPAVVGTIVNGLYNLIDKAFLGASVGDLGLAATTVAAPTMILFLALAMLIGVGGNALAAIKLGEGNKSAAEIILGNCVTLLIITAVIVAFIGWFCIDPLLTISGATPDSMEYSRQFIRILCLGFIFQGLGMGINNFIRTAGDPNRALWTMVIGAVICIILNFLFVMVLGWGVRGSALATVGGQAASAVSVLWYFLGKNAPFKLRAKNLRLRKRAALDILGMGLAPFALQGAAAVVNVVLNNLLNFYGSNSSIGADGALAVIGVVSMVSMFCIFPIVGVNMAAQPIEGFNYGAKNYNRVKEVLKTAMIWATVIAVFFFIVCELFPGPIVQSLGVSDEHLEFGKQALRIYVLAFPIVGVQIIGANYFQATGQPFKSAILAMTRQLIYLVPLLYFLPQIIPAFFSGFDSLLAICIAAPTSDFLAFLTVFIFLVFEGKRIKAMMAAEQAEKTEA